jgi:hypothetical protein
VLPDPLVGYLRAAWLAAPMSSRRGWFCERNLPVVRPLRAATAETEGVISCESLQLIAFSGAPMFAAGSSLHRAEQAQNGNSRAFRACVAACAAPAKS